ncbi:MAG: hypothetical protein GY749_50105 [Desulfobacteraceae bacterium]|nr:hypothetical protein [Desulfobacteraceae bacterium]
MLESYFNKIVETLSSYNWVESIEIIRYYIAEDDQKHILIYRLYVSLADNNLLEMMEKIVRFKADGNIFTTKYSFHLQDADKSLIKRWDNAPHHLEITTHPPSCSCGQGR